MEAEEEKEYNVAKFLRPSEVKIPVYRATADHHDLDADIAGVLAREVGIHLGEDEAQVASIIATQMDGDRFRAFAANEGKLTVTKPEIDNYFENYLGRYEDQQVRIGSGEGLAGSEGVMDLKPYAITKGYVQIKKPLDMDDMKLGPVIATPGPVADKRERERARSTSSGQRFAAEDTEDIKHLLRHQ